MNITEIERHKFPKVVSWNGTDCADLVKDCAELLGYAVPTKDAKTEGRLHDVLAELEIEILDANSVEKYQFEKLVETERAVLTADHANPSYVSLERLAYWRQWSHQWQQLPIDKYPEVIPAFVLNKAVQIKRAMPEVELIVEHLGTTPDPFLIARIKKNNYEHEFYYVEVWDEPTFR